ncbi:MAG TPA: type II secretion system protein GspC [Minicystis sp.]|nr:type II secretion system protein GspC [Minicystis sp.]
MGLDAVIKRYFPAVLCVLIGIAAYFQAAGMGQLVVASVALDPSSVPVAAPASRFSPRTPARVDASEHTASAAAILSRNPFDSVTGPLDGKALDIPSAPSATVDANRNPYDDPNCDFAKVILIASSEDPSWSFAVLAGTDGKSQMRRQGDDFSGHQVFFVGDMRSEEDRKNDRRDVWDRVWMTSGATRCQLRVGGPPPTKGAASATPPPSGESMGRHNRHKVPPEIASKIHKINDHEFDVERSVVDSILENQAELMRSARVVPEKEGDKIVGIRLFGIRQDSLLGTLGLENGDRLSSINGFEMSDPQKALEAYARLRTADHLTVSVNRHGSPMNIDFNIK